MSLGILQVIGREVGVGGPVGNEAGEAGREPAVGSLGHCAERLGFYPLGNVESLACFKEGVTW